jgi:L-alanine-DL-glutamate epimerase-like enolase superfamily enzyme
MPRPWVPEAPEMHFVIVDVEDSDGAIGSGFSWTPTIGASAIEALLRDDIGRFAIGKPADARTLWPMLSRHLHEAGAAGLAPIALAGLDLALWDLAGRREQRSVAALIGRRRDSVPVYGSGVNLHYPLEELTAQAARWRDGGYRAVKVKVGNASLEEDVRRVAAVRSAIGADTTLRIDANQRWTPEQAAEAIAELAQFDLDWVEEPVRAEDTEGYRRLRRRTDQRIAVGENVHHRHRFRELIEAGVADVLQPNVIRVGGITPFLQIAELILESGAVLAPHILPDLSAQLALTTPVEVEVEDVEDAGLSALGVLAEPSPVRREGGRLHVAEAPGLGFAFVSGRGSDEHSDARRSDARRSQEDHR